MTNLNDLLKLLLENDFDFVIVGGFAGVMHGASTTTVDLDLCIAFDQNKIEKLREVLKNYNPFHRLHTKKLSFLKFPQDISNIKTLNLSTDLGVLDFISEIEGVGNFERVSKNAVTIELFGLKCKVISLEDLIQSKKKMNGAKDKILLDELLQIQKHKNK